ncbi:MAG TPA: FtsX-like permease family protein, partial [Thermoanaerobaculia bacterium]
GVDPDKEVAVSQMLAITAGQNLASGDPRGIILGEGLATSMGVSLGDTVVLLTSTSSGGMNAIEVHVRGLFSTHTKAFDDAALRLPIPATRDLLRAPGSHTWVILLDDTDRTASLLQQLRARFPAARSGLQFRPWWEMADFYEKTVRLFSRQMGVVHLIIGLIIVLSISNTLTKSVLERTGEIGTLLATGTRRRVVLKLFVLEGLVLGVVGGLAGLVIGVGIARLVSSVGIPMPPPPGSSRSYVAEILVTPPLALRAFVVSIATALLASLHPAWRASRLAIVDALRHNR